MIKDRLIKLKLRYQRGVGHISSITGIISVYTAMKVSITQFPTEIYIAIIPCYLLAMWTIGYLDEYLEWSKREVEISRGMIDPETLKMFTKVNK